MAADKPTPPWRRELDIFIGALIPLAGIVWLFTGMPGGWFVLALIAVWSFTVAPVLWRRGRH
jgi:hypothetical protein